MPEGGNVNARTLIGDMHPAKLHGLGLAVLLSGYALSIVDIFIVNVALTAIGDDLHASTTALGLIVSGYGIAYATALVLGGRLGDAFGRRRMFVWGVASFTAASALCGLASTVVVLIIARAIQGFTAALMVPQVLATIQASTTGDRRARAIGLYGAVAGLAAVVGQVLGGLLIAADLGALGWRSVFLINVPVGLLVLVLVKTVPSTKSPVRPGLDPAGTVLFGIGMLALLLLLLELRTLAWGWLVGFAVACVSGLLLIRHERHLSARGGSPLLPPVVLRQRSIQLGIAAMVAFSAGFGAFMFVYALVVQQYLGLTPLVSGLVLAPFASMFLLVSLATPRITARLGRRIVTLGALVQGCGLLLAAAFLHATWPHPPVAGALAILAVVGIGQALIGPTLFRMILSDVPADLAGLGSGVIVTSQQAATALGAAIGGSLVTSLAGVAGEQSSATATAAILVAFSAVVLGISTRLPEPR